MGFLGPLQSDGESVFVNVLNDATETFCTPPIQKHPPPKSQNKIFQTPTEKYANPKKSNTTKNKNTPKINLKNNQTHSKNSRNLKKITKLTPKTPQKIPKSPKKPPNHQPPAGGSHDAPIVRTLAEVGVVGEAKVVTHLMCQCCCHRTHQLTVVLWGEGLIFGG